MLKRLLLLFLLLFMLVGICSGITKVNAQTQSSNRYIVVLKDDVRDTKGAASDIAKTHGLALGHIYKSVLKGFSASVPNGHLDALKKDARVKFVSLDRKVSMDARGGSPGKPNKPTPSPTPTPTPTVTPTPTPVVLSITVTSPNGGETMTVGDVWKITWNSSSNIDKVTLGYSSCPSCLDWIANNIPNTNSYDWTVNVGNTVNTQFKIYIIGYYTGYGSVSDYSDSDFTVLPLISTPTPTPILTPTNTPTPTPTPAQRIPTGISRIGATPSASSPVTVAILDSGIDLTHPDLTTSVIASTSCISSAPTANDDNGHGSHVAGTIAAQDNGIGVIGVVPSTSLAAIKVLDKNGWGYWSEIICGIDWVTTNANTYNIKVANMSLGGIGSSDNACGTINNDPLHQAICNSVNAGITYVVSAGNESKNASQAVPAAYDDAVITVSALADSDGTPGGLGSSTSYGSDDTFATFSNFGSVVDIGAPGVSILSTYKGGAYAYMSGTSMAAPHVSGAVAQYLAAHSASSWTQVLTALLASAEPIGSGHTDPSGLHPESVLSVRGL